MHFVDFEFMSGMASTLYHASFGEILVHELCMYIHVLVENEAIYSWAISKRSTNTELETDVSRNVFFQLYHPYCLIT